MSPRHVGAWALCLIATGCGGTQPKTSEVTFPSEALSTMSSKDGHYLVAVRSSPQPPVRGEAVFQLVVTDSNGGVPNLEIGVQPWMPLMGHGTSTKPEVKEMGDGVYEISHVYLYMSGLWELRTNLNGEVADSVAPQFEIH